MIVIVDPLLGNPSSIANMIARCGGSALISNDKTIITNASKLILPGVGAFDQGMKNLHELGLVEPIKHCACSGVPILGICLGMQLLTTDSEEGLLPGIGLVDAHTVRFQQLSSNMKIPHMGWNNVHVCKQHQIISAVDDSSRFYFVHSFHVQCANANDILLTTRYGHNFISAFAKENVIGVQFHPEKSHKYGMNLLRNFLEM